MQQSGIFRESVSRYQAGSSLYLYLKISWLPWIKPEGDYHGLAISLPAGMMLTWKQPRMSLSCRPGMAGSKSQTMGSRIWGGGPAGKMLAVQAWGPAFGPLLAVTACTRLKDNINRHDNMEGVNLMWSPTDKKLHVLLTAGKGRMGVF